MMTQSILHLYSRNQYPIRYMKCNDEENNDTKHTNNRHKEKYPFLSLIWEESVSLDDKLPFLYSSIMKIQRIKVPLQDKKHPYPDCPEFGKRVSFTESALDRQGETFLPSQKHLAIGKMEVGPLKTNQWSVPNHPSFEGKYCLLERLDNKHFEDLYQVRTVEDAPLRYKYLFSLPPAEKDEFYDYMTNLAKSSTFVAYAVIDKKTNRAEGIQSFMTINPVHGSMEIGGILWGPNIARTPVTTEAFYLFTKHAFDDLHYRRYEWKCNNDNAASRNAALRFGFQFEGLFRKHLIQNGFNRDTAYFSMLDSEWPKNKIALEQWLDEANFDDKGNQIQSLAEIRNAL